MTRPRVALFKSAGRAEAFAQALRDVGFEPVLVSPFRCEDVAGADAALDDALSHAATWAAATSPHAVPCLARALSRAASRGVEVRVAAVGPGTAGALHAAGVRTRVVGDGGGADLARALVDVGCGARDVVVHAAGDPVRGELREGLASAGARVVTVPVYSMVADPVGERAAEGVFDAVVVASPRLAERAAALCATRPPVVAVGATSADALRAAGWTPAAVAEESAPSAVARQLAQVLALGRGEEAR